jgi:hypothetical protein
MGHRNRRLIRRREKSLRVPEMASEIRIEILSAQRSVGAAALSLGWLTSNHIQPQPSPRKDPLPVDGRTGISQDCRRFVEA